MNPPTSKRRGHGEDSIYWDESKSRYVGAVSLGHKPDGTRIRRKVSGRTKAEVRDKLRELHQEVSSGLRPRKRYTVGDALEDWLAHGVDGLSARTVTLYRGTIVKALADELGAVSLLTGLRTEEVRALLWDHVVAWVGGQWQPVSEAGFDHEQLAVFVWRSDRAGGDTKTPRSRRTLALPRKCVEALREHRVRQATDRLAAGSLWQDHNLVFASTVGTPQDDHNVRRQFRVITEAAGLGTTWVPRELRHTFVSLLSAHGVPVEAIALLAGHNQTATTELVYRHQIVPSPTRGAEVMDQIFG